MPAALIPCIAFLATQYIAFGQFKPVYEEFGTKSYQYEGSYWNTPLEMDWFNTHPEPYSVYLLHMTFGHHGVFSLAPALLVLGPWPGAFALDAEFAPIPGLADPGALDLPFHRLSLQSEGEKTTAVPPRACAWLFWLIPFWYIYLPKGVEGDRIAAGSVDLLLAALLVSVFSVGYALKLRGATPGSSTRHEHLNLYSLQR